MGLTYEDIMNDNMRLHETIKRLQAENARLKSLLENSEMTVAEVIDANEKMREALQAMSEAVYEQPVGVWFTAIRTALAPPPQR